MTQELFRVFFLGAAAWNELLGLAFFVGYRQIYARFGIPLPNHPAYVQLPALWLAILGLADHLVARDLVRNRDLVTIRILMKLAFSAVCFYYFMQGTLSGLWLVMAWGNVVFLIPQLLFLGYVTARRTRTN